MSHGMRTPLNGLLGTIQRFPDHSLTVRQSDLLERMQQSGRLLLYLVNDVLDLAKLEPDKMVAESAPFSLPDLPEGAIETTAPLTPTSVGHDRPARNNRARDARRLRHVLLNLVSNTVKFTRDGTI